MIVYFASDLLWASKIKAHAEAIGINARPVRDVGMLDARLGDSDVRGMVVDLDAPETAFTLLARLREHVENAAKIGKTIAIRTAAFGPHVDTLSLDRARREGCDLVLTRGAMERSMERVLRELEGAEQPPSQ
jgi:hypothetical protein